MIPGEVFPAEGELELNAGRETVTLDVANTGDRPVQVGSHYHFFETNEALDFAVEELPHGSPAGSNGQVCPHCKVIPRGAGAKIEPGARARRKQ